MHIAMNLLKSFFGNISNSLGGEFLFKITFARDPYSHFLNIAVLGVLFQDSITQGNSNTKLVRS